MPTIKRLVTQSGSDTSTRVSVDTNLTVDGRAGWNIEAVRAYWVDCSAVAAADWSISAVVSTVDSDTTSDSADEIVRVPWAAQNTAGTAVALTMIPQQFVTLLEPRATVQPTLYFGVQSAATSQANDVVIEVLYSVIKLTDLEVLRMLAAGA